ncbi:MAG: TolC family protein [Alistipes sp.]|nr:TolC family protein [Alistipes sp.]
MMIHRLFISILFALSATSVIAQISVNEYVASVVEYSHAIRSAEAKVEGADAEYRVAKRSVLPSISLSSDATYGFEDNAPLWAMRADMVQPIYNGGRNTALMQQRDWEMVNAESGLRHAMLNVKYEAEVAYWALSRAEIYRQAMQDYIAIVQSLKSVAQHRFEEGYTSKSDLLQVESRLSNAEYQLSEAEQSWRIALSRFNTMRGEDVSVEVVLSDGIFDSFAMPMREDLATIIANHPDYLAAEANAKSAQCGIALRKAEYLPSLNAGLFGLWQPTTTGSVNGGVLFSLNVPIFHFMERRDAVRSAESSYTSLVAQLADVVDNITLNESRGWTNLEYSHRRMEAVQRNLDIARENLDISTYSYREGVATILDVLQAQISWLQIYENAIAAEYDYAVAIASYRYIIAR